MRHAAAAIILITAFAAEGETRRHAFESGKHGKFTITLPNDWRVTKRQAGAGLPYTIVLLAPNGKTELLLTPMWLPNDDLSLQEPENVRALMAAAAKRIRPTAIQKELPLEEIRTGTALGYYFWASDKARPSGPGDYLHMAQGTVPVGKMMVSFTILTNEQPPEGLAPALDIVRSSEHSPSPQ